MWCCVAEEEGFGGVVTVECGHEVASVETGVVVVGIGGTWGAEGGVFAEAGRTGMGWSGELLRREGVGGPCGDFARCVVAESEVGAMGEFEVGSRAGGEVRLGLEGGEDGDE